MFPQSELDNYKLQVELLQEKLQRSEISRQQLEHKLDKIFQKRDEHEKIVRSKAREKYQQFLEEQQQRNDRNKQLVMMLERIEQQTEVLNARSERLKMMKLQYEMYFAKLVHAQTRRCIQSSVQPMAYFMPTSSPQPEWSAMQQSTIVGHNYVPNAETTTPLGSNNSYQKENMQTKTSDIPTLTKNSDIPSLTNFVKREERGHYYEPKNIKMAPSPSPQQLYQNNIKTESAQNMVHIPASFTQTAHNQEFANNDISYTEISADLSKPSVTYLLSNNRQLSESEENSNLSTISSSTIKGMQNLGMVPPKEIHPVTELPKPSRILNSNNVAAINNYANLSTVVQPLSCSQGVNEVSLKSANEKDTDLGSLQNAKDVDKLNAASQDAVKEIQNRKTIDLTNNDIRLSKQCLNPSNSLQLETINSITETLLNSSKKKNYFKKQSVSTEQTESEFLLNNTEINSSVTPVSIENIENEIYGELLSPLKTEEDETQETFNVVPKILENLVTQSEKIENPSSTETQINQESTSANNVTTINNNEYAQNLYNYEQNVVITDFSNVRQSEEPVRSFSDHTNYENINSAEVDERQQQYDYSNYDPTQYSYPGYIYDETTGEYKQDPNTPLEQYATDQQYTPEGYQQYEQQDYDYNQTYAEQPNDVSANVENTVNNDCDIRQKESSSSVTVTDTNVMQQQEMITQPQPTSSDEVSTSATSKVVKPASILSSADKTESQKKKKRVNFIDSSETDESAAPADKEAASISKPVNGNLGASTESDFDFSSSTDAEPRST